MLLFVIQLLYDLASYFHFDSIVDHGWLDDELEAWLWQALWSDDHGDICTGEILFDPVVLESLRQGQREALSEGINLSNCIELLLASLFFLKKYLRLEVVSIAMNFYTADFADLLDILLVILIVCSLNICHPDLLRHLA